MVSDGRSFTGLCTIRQRSVAGFVPSLVMTNRPEWRNGMGK